MKAVVVTRSGGPEVLEVHEMPDPQPKADEVIVRVEAVGMNFADTISTHGTYSGTPPPPFISGREFAGVVETTGERVMGYMQYGAAAEKIAMKPKLLWPQPKGWTSEQSAAFPVNFLTAYLAYWKAGLTSDALAVESADASGGFGTMRSATVLPHRSVPPANRIRSASRPTNRSLRKSRAAFAISGAPRSTLGASNPPSLTILPSLNPISRRSSTLTT